MPRRFQQIKCVDHITKLNIYHGVSTVDSHAFDFYLRNNKPLPLFILRQIAN